MISPSKSPLVLHAWGACTMYVPCASNPLSLVSQELLLSHGWDFPVCAMMITWCNGFIVMTNEFLVVLIIIRLISLRVLVMFLIHPLPSWSMTPLVSVRWAFQVQILIMLTRCMTMSNPPPWSRTPFVYLTGSLHVCVALYINHMRPYPNSPKCSQKCLVTKLTKLIYIHLWPIPCRTAHVSEILTTMWTPALSQSQNCAKVHEFVAKFC